MRIKPKILASNPPSILMPATGLYQREKRKIDFDNKAKTCISLANRRLHPLNLASSFNSIAPNRLPRLISRPFSSPPSLTNYSPRSSSPHYTPSPQSSSPCSARSPRSPACTPTRPSSRQSPPASPRSRSSPAHWLSLGMGWTESAGSSPPPPLPANPGSDTPQPPSWRYHSPAISKSPTATPSAIACNLRPSHRSTYPAISGPPPPTISRSRL
jgi:hypothetical protein